MNLGWEERAQAMSRLRDFTIVMRKPGEWYIDQNVEIGDGRFLTSVAGKGSDPIQALLNHWSLLTELRPGSYLVVDAYRETRRQFRWNGFMWDEVPRRR